MIGRSPDISFVVDYLGNREQSPPSIRIEYYHPGRRQIVFANVPPEHFKHTRQANGEVYRLDRPLPLPDAGVRQIAVLVRSPSTQNAHVFVNGFRIKGWDPIFEIKPARVSNTDPLINF
jgi:hypothetical protein